jgi:hypothetical protein
VRYTLASDYVVILEGILHAGRYGGMLRRLHHDFGGGWYFLQVSWRSRCVATRPARNERSSHRSRCGSPPTRTC